MAMKRMLLPLIALLCVALPAAAQSSYTMEQVRSYPFPNELAAAAEVARIAWAFNEEGRRNIYVAEAPDWRARKLTSYDTDDGQVLTRVQLSPDGRWVVYRRGGDDANWDQDNWGLAAVNAASMPVQPKIELWAVPFDGGEARVLAEGGDGPVIAPSGDAVLFERNRQVWSVPIDGSAPAKQLFFARGVNGSIEFSPDGERLAFVSNRGTHSMIGIFQDSVTPITWISPSTHRDGSPRWSPDGTSLAFVRRGGSGGPPQPILERRHQPWSIRVADARTGESREVWRAPETLEGSPPSTQGWTNLHWAAGNRLVFQSYHDGWPHLYSIDAVRGGEPLLLTPGDYQVEFASMSPDGRYVVFAGNAGDTPGDIDRRHIVKAPIDRSAPQVLTPGTGLEWTPVVTGDGATIALISATAQRPPLPAVMPVNGGPVRLIAEDRIPDDFPTRSLVIPKSVTFRADDGVTVHAQVFEKEGGPARKPAVIFIHGGPPRQMLAGWHYSDYYANAYAAQQYFAELGFVALSVNYRLGIGYGFDFHRPPNAGAQGAAEYRDIVAAGEYLRSLPQVDADRIGVWGGSYGGYLTAMALARDSDMFAAGVDIHGVHNFADRFTGPSNRYEPTDREQAAEIGWRSSPIAYMDTWTSPVLLIHGDDDRNVRFSETVDLARRLELQGVPFEELIIPDDTHHFLRHANWIRVNEATAEFLEKHLR
ncbi:MAG TPA: prolyl oligopeptidase family serine peptidase [Longimicrobiales bacterium]|nr:prolyl oligopeptidase family serine peptidase [Longimicrobiales bacterium]